MALFDDFDAYPDGPLAGNGTWVDVSTNTGHNRITSGDVTTTLAGDNGSLTVPADIGSGNQFVEIDALDTPTGNSAGFPIALRAEDKLNFLGVRTVSDTAFEVIDRISQTLNILATTSPGFSLKNRNWRLRVHGTDFQASSGSLNLGFGQTNSNALIQRAGMLAWTDPSTPMTTWFQDVQTDALSTPDNTLNCRAPTAGWGEVSQGSVLGGTLGAYAIYMQFAPGHPGVATNDLIGLVGSHTGPGANRILARYNRSLPAIQFFYYGSDATNIQNTLTLSQTLDPHYWNGIAYRWDGSTTKVFLYRTSDGVAQESAEVSATSPWTGSTLRMHFGATTSLTTMNGGGVFGEVAIYEGTIPTDAQLAQLCARTALASDFAPAHYYPLDTVASAGNAVDTVASADFSRNATTGLFNTFDIRTYPTPAAAAGVNAAFAAVEDDDIAAITGTVVPAGGVVNASFLATEDDDVAAITGTVVPFVPDVVNGAFVATEDDDVAAITGTVVGTLTLNEPADGSITQRASGVGDISVSGTYSGNIADLQARLVLDGTSTAVSGQDWQSVSGAAGSWNHTFTNVVQGGWYNVQARFSTGTAPQVNGANQVGIGDYIAIIGSVNAEGWFTLGASPGVTANALLRKYDGTYSTIGASADGAKAFGNGVLENMATPVPIVLMDYGVTDTGIIVDTGAANGYWTNFASPPYSTFIAAIGTVGGSAASVVFIEGEEDAASNNVTEAEYEAALTSLIAQLRTDITNASNRPALPVMLNRLGRGTAGANVDANWQGIRQAQSTVSLADNNVFASASYDYTLRDVRAYSDAGYVINGRRVAQSQLFSYGDVPQYRGPAALSWVRVSNTELTVTILHSSGNDFTPESPTSILGFRYLDNGVPITISTALKTSATTIQIILASTPAGTGTLQYAYGFNPPITDIVEDNSALTLPMYSFTPIPEATPPTGGITPELNFWWWPSEDAIDTPDLTGLDTRSVNGNPSVTLEHGGNSNGANAQYIDSAGVLQTLPAFPAQTAPPRWNHKAALPYEALGALNERALVEWNRALGPHNWYNPARGIFYVEFYYDQPRAVPNPPSDPAGIYLQLRTSAEIIITINLNDGTDPPPSPSTVSIWGQVRAGPDDQEMTFLTEVSPLAGGLFRAVVGWDDTATPLAGPMSIWAGQQEDLAGNPVNWGAGAGEGVKIGERTGTFQGNVPNTSKLTIPGDDSTSSGANREPRVNIRQARYYDRYDETFMQLLASGKVIEGAGPAAVNVFQLLM